jgi:dCTP deaminase
MMMVLNDKQIAKRAAQGMIEPFVDKQVRDVVVESNYEGKLVSTTGKKLTKVVSYGLSSFGYDIRIGTKFRVFSNAHGCPVIDPKNFEPKALVEIEVEPHEAVIIPPNSYVLGLSLEYFRIPTDIVTICLGKSTYARSGILVNVTPFEPGWVGHAVLEISNMTPLPAKVYAGEGIAQVLFLKGEPPATTYADRQGRYQDQRDIVTSRV